MSETFHNLKHSGLAGFAALALLHVPGAHISPASAQDQVAQPQMQEQIPAQPQTQPQAQTGVQPQVQLPQQRGFAGDLPPPLLPPVGATAGPGTQGADPAALTGTATGTAPDGKIPRSGLFRDNQGRRMGLTPQQAEEILAQEKEARAAEQAQQKEQRAQEEETLRTEIRKEAFDAALTGLMPLKPAEIRELLDYYDKTQEAVETPIYDFPVPEVAVQTVSLDPGVAPPTVKVAAGHVSTLNTLDVTGAPWPIQDVTWAGDFEIIEPEEGGHIVRITPLSEFAYGNMSVRMLGLKTPVTFSLRTARDVVHYRLDARIPEYGPFANVPLIEGSGSLRAGDSLITSVLEGVAPADSVRLKVSGVDGRTTAYKIGELTYVRTPLTLLSPGWSSSVSSADGMHVYALEETPVLLLSDEGRFMRAHLKEEESGSDE